MDNDKELSSLQILNAESEKPSNPIYRVDSEFSSWNSTKFPSLNVSEVHFEKVINSNETKPSFIPLSETMVRLISKIKGKNDFQKPDSRLDNSKFPLVNCENSFKSPRLTYKNLGIQLNTKYSNSLEESPEKFKKNTYPNKNTNFFNKTLAKKYYCHSLSNNKTKEKNKKIHDRSFTLKINEIIKTIRSPTPDTQKKSPKAKNKLSIRMAKNLEELLYNSKLPGIQPKRLKTQEKSNRLSNFL
jgi:hypothetical protein